MKKYVRRIVCCLLAVSLLLSYPIQIAKAEDNGIEDFVTRLYTLCLNRTPDAVGLEDWCTQLSSGSSTGTKVAHGFVFSNEFTSAGYSDEEFVQLMYRIFLGREADTTGLNDWLNRMRNQGYGREAVFNGFSQSQEFNSICTEYGIVRGNAVGKVSDDISSFVIRFYQVCLGRDADATGLDYWASQLKEKTVSAAEVAYGFVFSPEFLNKNYDDATFVKYMYQAFLDRTADSVGLADWTAKLQNGSTREDVFYGFVGSNEFAGICEDYGITRDDEGEDPGEAPTFGVKIEAIAPLSDGTDFISCGGDVIITRKDGKYGAVKKSGETIVENKYEFWWVMNEDGMTAFQSEDTVYCYDTEGNMIHSIENPYQIFIGEGYITYAYTYTRYFEDYDVEKVALGIYDINARRSLPVEMIPFPEDAGNYEGSPVELWDVQQITPVEDGKFFVTWDPRVEGDEWSCSVTVEIDVKTFEAKAIHWGWRLCRFLPTTDGYGATVGTDGGGCWIGLLSEDGEEEYKVDAYELLEKYVGYGEKLEDYFVVEYYQGGQECYNRGKQVVAKLTTDSGKDYCFLIDLSEAEQEEREPYNSPYSFEIPIVSNLSDVVLAKHDSIVLNSCGSYLACDGDDLFYINDKGEKIADYVGCSDFVGNYAVVIEEDGLAYVIDTEFNKVSEGYPADRIGSLWGALCFEKDGQRTLLYVEE